MDDQNSINPDGNYDQADLAHDRKVLALFASQDDARGAEQALIEAGFDEVSVAWNGDEAAERAENEHQDDIWTRIKSFFGGHKDTELYGEGLKRGQSLLTVHTEQAHAQAAVEILDRYNPTDVAGAEQTWKNEDPTPTRAADDIPAEDRPAYASAATDFDQPTTTSVPVTSGSAPANRDAELGNARVRSYAPGSR